MRDERKSKVCNGTCPICNSTRIKLLYPRAKTNGTVVTVCKKCSKADQNKLDAV
ncbi:hypothetical protein [Paenibacillus lutimineralis]|uniref:hypothetical protein n=1 Tax=Paenibacillus lutimineralis TaxID=2707005 RepID=UPI001D04E778|nr:hypothetical protein [Paenibacillus lutimineralis]